MTRRHPSLAVAVLAAVCGLAAPAFAQYRPSEPPPEPVPEAAPAPASTPEGPASVQTTAARPPGWSWEPGFVLDASYEENVAFTQPPGPNETFGALAASLARVRRGPRSSFRLAVTGVGYLYPQTHGQDRVDAFASLSTQGPLSRRVDGRLRGNYDFAHTDSESSLIYSGVLLPLVRTQTAGAGAGLTWRLARRTSLALDGTWLQVNFESGPYIDTTTWGGLVLLSHQVARRDSLSLQGSFTRTDSRGSPPRTTPMPPSGTATTSSRGFGSNWLEARVAATR